MASPEEVAHFLPDTLPEDFSEWDGESAAASRAERPIRVQEAQPSPSVLRGASVAPGVGRPRSATSTWPAAEALRPQERAGGAEPSLRSVAPRLEGGRPRIPFQPAVHDPRLASSGEVSSGTVTEPEAPLRSEAHSRAGQRAELRQASAESAVARTLPNPGKVLERPVPPEVKAGMTEAALLDLFRENVEEMGEQRPAKTRQIVIAAVAACILLLALLLIPVLRRGGNAAAKQAVAAVPAAAATQSVARVLKPGAGKSSSMSSKKAESSQAAGNDAANSGDEADAEPEQQAVQSAMMNEQLTAQSRIPQAAKSVAAGEAPPPVSLGTYGMSGNAPSSAIFKAKGKTVVQAAPSKPIAVSAGVANGMLLRKTTPIYPEIAKQARVAGTVVLAAVISKTGSITDLRVVSGPSMLRRAAQDAVRTWQYRPYELNGQPIEMQTTINVVFTLGG